MNPFRFKMKREGGLPSGTYSELVNVVMNLTEVDKLDLAVKILSAFPVPRLLIIIRQLIVCFMTTGLRQDTEALRELGNHCCRLADGLERDGAHLSTQEANRLMGQD